MVKVRCGCAELNGVVMCLVMMVWGQAEVAVMQQLRRDAQHLGVTEFYKWRQITRCASLHPDLTAPLAEKGTVRPNRRARRRDAM